MTNPDTPIPSELVRMLPCPFCGDAPSNYSGPTLFVFPGKGEAMMRCRKCEARGPLVRGSCEESTDAIGIPARLAWNERQAASLILSQEEIIKELVEALRPFAESRWTGLLSAEVGTHVPDRDVFEVSGLKVRDFDKARSVLSRNGGGK